MPFKLKNLTRKIRANKNKITEGEAKFQALIRYAGDAIFMVDSAYCITEVNDGACRLLQYSAEEFLQMKIYELMTAGDRESFMDRARIIEKEGGSIHERKLKRKDGSLVDTEVNVRPVEGVGYISIIRDITERKRVEKELIESEIRFREVLENSLSASYKRNLQTNAYEYLSPVFKKIAGYTQDEMNSLPLETVIGMMHPDDVGVVKNGLIKAMSEPGGSENSLEYRFKHKTNGEYRWLKDEFVVMQDAEGQLSSLIGSVSDITERKNAEAVIKEQAETFSAIIENANESIWLLSPDLKVLQFNKTAKERLRVNSGKEIYIGADFKEFLYTGSENIFMPMFNDAVAGKYIEQESQQVNMEGKMFWLRTKMYPVYDSRKKLLGVTLLAENITDRKKTEESIKRSEAGYRRLFDNSPAPMWVIDERTSAIMQVNKACISNYGFTEEEFLGMKFRDISPGESALASKTAMTDMFFMGSRRHIKKTGELIDVITSSIPISLNGENNILMIAIDVTEKNLYEQKLTKAAIKAQEEERYEIGGELHDNVCQILAGALMTLGLLKSALPLDSIDTFDQTYRYINDATVEIRNLSHRLAPAFFDKQTLEEAFVGLLNSFNMGDKYSISLNVDTQFKQQALNRDLQLNLYRILQEQLRNIMKHAKATTIDVEVSVKNDNRLEMGIADNGIGFDAKTIKGGIGLANMNRRVQLFSGTFTINSAPGKGCKVLAEVPLS